jgi:hypothetical protein
MELHSSLCDRPTALLLLLSTKMTPVRSKVQVHVPAAAEGGVELLLLAVQTSWTTQDTTAHATAHCCRLLMLAGSPKRST